jgi:DNA repair photolyase
MALYFQNLDDRTRQLMLDEMEYDIANNQLHISPFLSGQGQRDYANLLRQAIQSGNDQTLAESLRLHRRILKTLPRRQPKPKGGYSIAATPENAAEVLAESEFNRYYIRGLARRAIEDSIPELVIYRAKPARNPRPESEARVETSLSPQELLEDLRAHPGDEPPTLGVPSGPNSGLSVRLP